MDDRIWVNPSPPVKGQMVEVGYRGLLAKSGADRTYLHYGFDDWKNPKTVPMSKIADGSFSARILVEGERDLNFCFKDSADHWDNNSGWNWTQPIVKR